MAKTTKYQLKTDPQGMVGRECPNNSCKSYFKVEAAETDCDELTCPVCSHTDDCKKYTTVPQIEYINSLIFNHDSCPIPQVGYAKTHVCRDYVEIPAKCVYKCDICNKKFGIDCIKPEMCPYCQATREHLHAENRCDLNCKE